MIKHFNQFLQYLAFLSSYNEIQNKAKKSSFQKHTSFFFFQSRERDDCFLKKYMEEKKYTKEEVRYALSVY